MSATSIGCRAASRRRTVRAMIAAAAAALLWALPVAPSSASTVVSSFNPQIGTIVALGFDAGAENLLLHAANTETIERFSPRGGRISSVLRPGASTNDFDLDVADESLEVGGTSVPAGTVLAINGDNSPITLFGVDGNDGEILASLVVPVAGGTVGGSYHPQRDTYFFVDWTQDHIREIDPADGRILNEFTVRPGDRPFDVFFGDVAVAPNGDLVVVSDVQNVVRQLTATGGFVADYGVGSIGLAGMSGIDFDPATGNAWIGSTNGNVWEVDLQVGGEPPFECDPEEPGATCGTTGDDDLEANDGTVEGGPGNDDITGTIDSETNSLTIDGGSGEDTIVLDIQDPSSQAIITVSGGDGNDTILIPPSPGSLTPTLNSGDGNDIIDVVGPPAGRRGTAASAALQGEGGSYVVDSGPGNDVVTAGTSADQVVAGGGADVVDGGGGPDELSGAAGPDKIEGGAGADRLLGGAGKDRLHGSGGANDFIGGPGPDTCLSDVKRDEFKGCERIRRNHRRAHG